MTPPFTSPLPPAGLTDFAEREGREIRLMPGQYLCWEGEPATDFYRVDEGEIRLQIFAGDLGLVTIAILGPGEWLGWSWLLPPHEWALTAYATTRASVRACDATALRRAADADSRLGFEIARFVLRLIARRIRDTRHHLLEVC